MPLLITQQLYFCVENGNQSLLPEQGEEAAFLVEVRVLAAAVVNVTSCCCCGAPSEGELV